VNEKKDESPLGNYLKQDRKFLFRCAGILLFRAKDPVLKKKNCRLSGLNMGAGGVEGHRPSTVPKMPPGGPAVEVVGSAVRRIARKAACSPRYPGGKAGGEKDG